jgi:hypothetical protein
VKIARFTSDHRRRKVPKVGRAKFYLLLPGPTVYAAHWIQKLPGPGTGRPNRLRRLCIRFCYTLVTLANVHGNNRADQKVNFGFQNALNLAYVHLQFSRSKYPRPLKRGREGRAVWGRVRKWKGEKDRRMGAGEEGTGREGTGGSPFTNSNLGLP